MKELKVARAINVLRDSLVRWNPVKELKVEELEALGYVVVDRVESVESGEGIESRSRRRSLEVRSQVESGEGIESYSVPLSSSSQASCGIR